MTILDGPLSDIIYPREMILRIHMTQSNDIVLCILCIYMEAIAIYKHWRRVLQKRIF